MKIAARIVGGIALLVICLIALLVSYYRPTFERVR
jgi:hypothetical protein